MYCQFLSEEVSNRFQKTNFGLNQHNLKILSLNMMLQNAAGNVLHGGVYSLSLSPSSQQCRDK